MSACRSSLATSSSRAATHRWSCGRTPGSSGTTRSSTGTSACFVLQQLGHDDALCFVWPCDDATALLLLATLNRLEGEDLPARRAELLTELSAILPAEELALLLPEDATAIEQTLRLIDLDTDALLAELTEAAQREAARGPRLISFAVDPDDEPVIEEAIGRSASTLVGRNRRGRALAAICRAYLEATDA